MSELPTRLLRDRLRESLTDAAAEPTPQCVDAGALAAWADDALSVKERTAVESHAAGCARCMALLAAMSRSAPPLSPAPAWWRRPAFGWLAPFAAATAAFLVWFNVTTSDPTMPLVPGSTVQVRAPASVERVPPAAVSTDNSSKPETKVDQLADAGAQTSPPSGRAAGMRRDPARDDARQLERRRANGATTSQAAGASEQAAAQVPPAGAPAAAASAPPAAAAPSTAAPLAGAAPAPAAAAAVPPPPPPSPTSSGQRLQDTQPRAAESFSVNAMRAPALTMKAQSEPPQIVAATGRARWRIAANGVIERSTDEGATWEAQATGVNVMLTAGAAPSPTICWVVGPRGIVVRSTDGRTWQRVEFPQPIDLVSVRASDARNATVTTVDGRSFTTTDGGRTWTP